MTNEIRIYVADLAAYNNGKLHGVWIDATQELDNIWKAVNALLKASPEGFAEEYAIHDYEGFGCYRLSDYEGIESAHEIACFIEEFSDFGADLLAYSTDLEEAKRQAEESYQGCFKSLADYAEDFTEVTDTEIGSLWMRQVFGEGKRLFCGLISEEKCSK